jgi:hypothetical protein
MAKGAQRVHASAELQWLEALVNAGEPWPNPFGAWQRVRQMQAKLHRWAAEDPGRRFDDLFSLVYHPDFLTVAWERVSGNKGARTAGVDRWPRRLSPVTNIPAPWPGSAEATAAA